LAEVYSISNTLQVRFIRLRRVVLLRVDRCGSVQECAVVIG